MNRRVILALLSLSVVVGAGCFRTAYTNLTPFSNKPVEEPPNVSHDAPNSWQHFFIYGWVPSEKKIDAAKACGGAEHVERIETRQTFVQGLIAAFAGYYVNVYSPYTGAVICDHTREP